MATKLQGEGKALVAGPIQKKYYSCGFPKEYRWSKALLYIEILGDLQKYCIGYRTIYKLKLSGKPINRIKLVQNLL